MCLAPIEHPLPIMAQLTFESDETVSRMPRVAEFGARLSHLAFRLAHYAFARPCHLERVLAATTVSMDR